MRVSHARRTAVALLLSVPLLAGVLPAQAAETPVEPAGSSFTAPVAQQQTLQAVRKVKPDTKIMKAYKVALAQVGDPYAYGAAGPGSFDCSGLVLYSTRKAGIRGVPRTSGAQSGYMRRIPRSAMKVGDFVFFGSSGGVYHVGFYAGSRNGRKMILHSPRPGQSVRKDPIWTDGWFAGTLRGR